MVDSEHVEGLPVMEIGATEAIQNHYARHIISPKAVSQRKLDFERSRPRWLREILAEITGVFFYVYPGLAATVALTVTQAEPAYSSILQVGFAFCMGIVFAIITCAPVSGGHFNPAVTICFAIWQGFPWWKVPYYILSQCLGGFIASLVVLGQYWQQLSAVADASVLAGKGYVYSGGPAAALCSIPLPTQSLGYLFFIEFFVCFYLGVIIWATIDPANPFISPASAPFVLGLAYASMVWGFADITISTNLARDLGGRAVAAIFFGGGEVFTYKNYSWISLIVNIPATILATGFYELLMRDSLQGIGKGAALHEGGDDGLALHLTKSGITRDAGLRENHGKEIDREQVSG